MDIEKAFSFPFEDKEWHSKLGLGAALNLVPILNFAWIGYTVGILRNVMNGVPEPLPTWHDIGKTFIDGLIFFAAALIYASPLVLMICLPLGALSFSGILSGSNDLREAARAIAAAGGILLLGFLCLFFLYAIVLSIVSSAIFVIFAREGTFASCFKLGEAFTLISRNPGPFFTAWGMNVIAGLGVGLVVGSVNIVLNWIPCLGWIAALGLSALSAVYLSAVYAHLFGQFGREAFGQTQLTPVG